MGEQVERLLPKENNRACPWRFLECEGLNWEANMISCCFLSEIGREQTAKKNRNLLCLFGRSHDCPRPPEGRLGQDRPLGSAGKVGGWGMRVITVITVPTMSASLYHSFPARCQALNLPSPGLAITPIFQKMESRPQRGSKTQGHTGLRPGLLASASALFPLPAPTLPFLPLDPREGWRAFRCGLWAIWDPAASPLGEIFISL